MDQANSVRKDTNLLQYYSLINSSWTTAFIVDLANNNCLLQFPDLGAHYDVWVPLQSVTREEGTCKRKGSILMDKAATVHDSLLIQERRKIAETKHTAEKAIVVTKQVESLIQVLIEIFPSCVDDLLESCQPTLVALDMIISERMNPFTRIKYPTEFVRVLLELISIHNDNETTFKIAERLLFRLISLGDETSHYFELISSLIDKSDYVTPSQLNVLLRCFQINWSRKFLNSNISSSRTNQLDCHGVSSEENCLDDQAWRSGLRLGSDVEILLSPFGWCPGIVVKVNAVTDYVTVEFKESATSTDGCLMNANRNSDQIRLPRELRAGLIDKGESHNLAKTSVKHSWFPEDRHLLNMNIRSLLIEHFIVAESHPSSAGNIDCPICTSSSKPTNLGIPFSGITGRYDVSLASCAVCTSSVVHLLYPDQSSDPGSVWKCGKCNSRVCPSCKLGEVRSVEVTHSAKLALQLSSSSDFGCCIVRQSPDLMSSPSKVIQCGDRVEVYADYLTSEKSNFYRLVDGSGYVEATLSTPMYWQNIPIKLNNSYISIPIDEFLSQITITLSNASIDMLAWTGSYTFGFARGAFINDLKGISDLLNNAKYFYLNDCLDPQSADMAVIIQQQSSFANNENEGDLNAMICSWRLVKISIEFLDVVETLTVASGHFTMTASHLAANNQNKSSKLQMTIANCENYQISSFDNAKTDTSIDVDLAQNSFSPRNTPERFVKILRLQSAILTYKAEKLARFSSEDQSKISLQEKDATSYANMRVRLLSAAVDMFQKSRNLPRTSTAGNSTLSSIGDDLLTPVFEFIVTEVLDVLSEHVRAIIDNYAVKSFLIETPPSVSLALALSIVKTMRGSIFDRSSGDLSVYYIIRVLIIKCGLAIHLYVVNHLKSASIHALAKDTKPLLAAVNQLSRIENAYKAVLQLCLMGLNDNSSSILSDPIRESTEQYVDIFNAVCRKFGVEALYNGVIEMSRRVDSPKEVIDNYGLKVAMSNFILCLSPGDRYLAIAKDLRFLMKEFIAHGTDQNLRILESLWMEAIADWFTKQISPYLQSVEAGSQISANVIDRVICMLHHARDISIVDVRINPTTSSGLVADIAFATAFRRLDKESSFNLTKTLAVYISYLVDSQKQMNFNAKLTQKIDVVTDIIQVLYNHTSADFQHFYELLLARRLLRNRFMSLQFETDVLMKLPAMTKSHHMIRDISFTESNMDGFRSFILNRIEKKSKKSAEPFLTLLLQRNSLKIHLLSCSVWPSFWVSTIKFAGLKLPKTLQDIMVEFESFFYAQERDRISGCDQQSWSRHDSMISLSEDDSEDNSRRIISLPIAFSCKSIDLDEVFEPNVKMIVDGWPQYFNKRQNDHQLCFQYCNQDEAWQLFSYTDGTDGKIYQKQMLAKCMTGKSISLESLASFPWFVWNASQLKFLPSYPTITSLHASMLDKSRRQSSNQCTGTHRRLLWCHSAGTILLECKLEYNKISYILVTESQAAILLLYGPKVWNLTLKDISMAINLSIVEVTEILDSLLSAKYPILISDSVGSVSKDKSTFSLSGIFLSGSLGGYSEADPVPLSSNIHNDKFYSDDQVACAAGINSLHNWKNELVDACIVRYLKDINRTQRGYFCNSRGLPHCAVPLDLLCDAVKLSLESRCYVNNEDVIRRSEHLSSSGVIEKLSGAPINSLHSIAYAYLSGLASKSLQQANFPSPSPLKAPVTTSFRSSDLVEKHTDVELFNHMKIVFDINSLPDNIPGIHQELFVEKATNWLTLLSSEQNEIEYSNEQAAQKFKMMSERLSHQSSMLASYFIPRVTRQLRIAAVQLNCLIYQQRLPSTSSDYSIPNKRDTLTSTSTVLNELYDGATDIECKIKNNFVKDSKGNNFCSGFSHLLEDFHRSIFEHLPIDIVHHILSILMQLFQRNDVRKGTLNGVVDVESIIEALGLVDVASYRNAYSNGDDRSVNMNEQKSKFHNRESEMDWSEYYPVLRSKLISLTGGLWNYDHPVRLTDLLSLSSVESNGHSPFDANQDTFFLPQSIAFSIIEKISCSDRFKAFQDRIPNTDHNKRSPNSTHSPTSMSSDQYRSVYPESVDNSKKACQSRVINESIIFPLIGENVLRQDSLAEMRDALQSRSDEPQTPLRKLGASKENVKFQDIDTDQRSDNTILISLKDFVECSLLCVGANWDAWMKERERDDANSSISTPTAEVLSKFLFEYVVGNLYEVFKITPSCNNNISNSSPNNPVFNSPEPESRRSLSVSPLRNHFTNDFDFNDAEELRSLTVETDLIYLPCELCGETTRLDNFELHQLTCLRGGHLRAMGLQAPLRAQAAQIIRQSVQDHLHPPLALVAPFVPEINQTTPLENNGTTLRVDCELSHSLIRQLYEITTRHALIESDAIIPHGDDNNSSWTNILALVFSNLDREGDGVLSVIDFTGKTESWLSDDRGNSMNSAGLLGSSPRRDALNPVNIYGKLFESAEDPKSPNDVLVSPSLKNQTVNISRAPDLRKSESLWKSVSHDKSLPLSESARSFGDISEANTELGSLLEKTCDIIDEPLSAAIILLIHYKWNIKALVEDYIENYSLVRLSAGLGLRNSISFLRADWGSRSSDGDVPSTSEVEIVCGICFVPTLFCDAYSLSCEHYYCSDCWRSYLEIAVNQREIVIKCPHPNCPYVVPSDMIECLCSEKSFVDSRKVLIQAFVEDRRGRQVMATYCKNPEGCVGIVVMADDADSSQAVCSLCGYSFCANCDFPPHAPASCQQIVHWEERGGYLETGSEEDILARRCKLSITKPCPKCGVRIEKNEGCPHMTCTFKLCKYQFCWDCGGEFHTTTQCSRPKISTDQNPVLEIEELSKSCSHHFLLRQTALSHHTICVNRIADVHGKSAARSQILRILSEAWSAVSDSHAALAYTCIVGYTVKSDRLKILFGNQNVLTESLQGALERLMKSDTSISKFEIKLSIRKLRLRLREYILSIQAESCEPRVMGPTSLTPATPSRVGAATRASLSNPGTPSTNGGNSARSGSRLRSNDRSLLSHNSPGGNPRGSPNAFSNIAEPLSFKEATTGAIFGKISSLFKPIG